MERRDGGGGGGGRAGAAGDARGGVEIISGAAADPGRLARALREWAARRGAGEARVALEPAAVFTLGEADAEGGYLVEIPHGKRLVVEGNRATILRDRKPAGAPKFSFFVVRGGTLEVSDLTLQGGEALGAFGGAIAVVRGGVLRMTGCQIRECISTGRDGENGSEDGGSGGGGGGQGACGGAIYCARGSVFLKQCFLKDNAARAGAGGDAFTNRGRFTGRGGTGGGPRGGAAGISPGEHGGNAGQVQPGEELTGAFGGGGGASRGDRGSNGGDGLWGGGGGGAGARTMGGWALTGTPGAGGYGGGSGGRPGASSGSAGGGGGAFGGAVCVIDGDEVSIQDCVMVHNESRHGDGGKHSWGFPSGRRGVSFGGAIFVSGTQRVRISGEGTRALAFNKAAQGNNVFLAEREAEARIAQALVCKSPESLPWLVATSLLRHRQGDSPSDSRSDTRPRELPLNLAESIIEDFVGWELF